MSPHFVQQWCTTLTNNLRFGGKIWVSTESQTYNKTLGFREKTWVLVKKKPEFRKKIWGFCGKKNWAFEKDLSFEKKKMVLEKKNRNKKIIETTNITQNKQLGSVDPHRPQYGFN